MRWNIWDFWAKSYEGLWVQKYSLQPTRDLVVTEIQKRLSKGSSGENVELLDVGCGTGQLAEDINNKLRKYDIALTCVDFSQSMIDIAKKKAIPKTKFLKADVHGLPFESAVFDIITCSHSFPYYRDKVKALEEMLRVLKPGGCLYLIQASENSFYDTLVMRIVKLTTGRAQYPSKSAIAQLVEQAGGRVTHQHKLKTKSFMPSIILSICKNGDAL